MVVPDAVALREPAHRVSPRAVAYWRVSSLLSLLVIVAVATAVYLFWHPWPWYALAGTGALLVWELVNLAVMPTLRYRIHRWEVTPIAIYTQSGWLNRNQRIAPLSRVQTVDTREGALMRLFSLSSITVTTASAAGPVVIDCLDRDTARQVVAELTEITGASEGDAT